MTINFSKEFNIFILLCFVFLAILLSNDFCSIIFNKNSLRNDFDVYYIASKVLLEGKNPYEWSEGRKYVCNTTGLGASDLFYHPYASYLYPPTFAVFLRFLTKKLDLSTSKLIWYCLNFLIILLAITLAIIYFSNYYKDRSFNLLASLIFLLLSYNIMVYMCLQFSNINNFIFLLILLTLIFLRYKQDFFCALCLCISIIIKVSPLIFVIWLLFRKRYKIIAYLIFLLIIILSFEFIFFHTLNNWVCYIINVLPTISGATTSLSVKGFLLRIFTETPMWSPKHIDFGYIPILNRIDIANCLYNLYVLFVILCGTIFFYLTIRKSFFNINLEFALIVLVLNLITPQVWEHGLLFVFIPSMVILNEAKLYLENRKMFFTVVIFIIIALCVIFMPYIYRTFLSFPKPLTMFYLFFDSRSMAFYGTSILFIIGLFVYIKELSITINYKKYIVFILFVFLILLIIISINFYQKNRIFYPDSRYAHLEKIVKLEEAFLLKNISMNSQYGFMHPTSRGTLGVLVYKISLNDEKYNAIILKPSLYICWKGEYIKVLTSSNNKEFNEVYKVYGVDVEFHLYPTINFGQSIKKNYIFVKFELYGGLNKKSNCPYAPRLEGLKVDFVKRY